MLKKTWHESLQRYTAFWNNEPVDRPIVLFDTVGIIKNPMYNGAGYDYTRYGEDIGRFRQDFLNVWEQRYKCADDAIPCIAPQFGGAFEAALFASEIHWGSEVASLTPHNPIEHLECLDEVVFSPNNPYYARLLKETSFLAKNADGKYGVNYDGGLSITTAISQLRGGTRFMLDLVDSPEAVRRLAERIKDTFLLLQGEVDRLIPHPAGGTCHRWINYWNPGRGFWFSEDDAIMMSPAMYRDLFLDLNMELCASTDCAVLHWHTGGMHLIGELLKIPNMRMIQLSLDPKSPPLEDLLAACKKIADTGRKVCFQLEYDEALYKQILSCVPGDSCMFYIGYAEDMKQAERILAEIERLSKRS